MIGILAGMGPKSTAPFVDKVVQLCQQLYSAKNDMDFPPMMIYSCPTPFYLDRPLDHQAMENAIIDGAQKLASTGVDFIAVPCNTAHKYYADIQASVGVPVLNIVTEALRRLPVDSGRVGVLATQSTLDAGVYQEGLAKLGRKLIWQESWQRQVNGIISLIKGADGLDQAVQAWQRLLADMQGQVDSLLLACTDLNVVADRSPARLPMVDAGNCLAHAVVARYYMRLRQ